MAKNQDNVRGWNGELSGVFLAPKGTTLPVSSLEEPDAPFIEVGFISDAGVEESIEVETRETKAWQGGKIVKVTPTSTKKTHKFASLEENPEVTGLYYGHAKPTLVGAPGSEVAKVELPEAIPTTERTAVLRFVDGDRVKLKCIETVSVSERGTVAANVEDDTVYEFTITETGPSYWLTNDPAYIEAAA